VYTVVEPHPDVVQILRRNIARNFAGGALARINVIQGAAIPEQLPRMVEMSVPDEKRVAPVGAHLIEGVEISERESARVVRVAGIPFHGLVTDQDVIKIDAEGIEYMLLSSVRHLLVEHCPALVIEVLPESEKLGVFVASLAAECGYTINVVPGYGSEAIVTVPPAQFTSRVPRQLNSKDIVLYRGHLRE